MAPTEWRNKAAAFKQITWNQLQTFFDVNRWLWSRSALTLPEFHMKSGLTRVVNIQNAKVDVIILMSVKCESGLTLQAGGGGGSEACFWSSWRLQTLLPAGPRIRHRASFWVSCQKITWMRIRAQTQWVSNTNSTVSSGAGSTQILYLTSHPQNVYLN